MKEIDFLAFVLISIVLALISNRIQSKIAKGYWGVFICVLTNAFISSFYFVIFRDGQYYDFISISGEQWIIEVISLILFGYYVRAIGCMKT